MYSDDEVIRVEIRRANSETVKHLKKLKKARADLDDTSPSRALPILGKAKVWAPHEK